MVSPLAQEAEDAICCQVTSKPNKKWHRRGNDFPWGTDVDLPFFGGEAASLVSVQYRDAPRFRRDKLWSRAMSNYILQRSKPQAWLYPPVLLNTIVVLMFTNCGTWTSDINPSLGFFINEMSNMVPQTMLLGEWSSGSMPDIQQVSLTTTVAFDWHLGSFSSYGMPFPVCWGSLPQRGEDSHRCSVSAQAWVLWRCQQ